MPSAVLPPELQQIAREGAKAADRPAPPRTATILGLGLHIHSAHIATYGERAVDVFYLTGRTNRKLTGEESERLRDALLEAAGEASA